MTIKTIYDIIFKENKKSNAGRRKREVYTMEKAKRTPDAIRAQWEVKISVSNSKTGIPSFNTLAGTGIYNGCTPRTERALDAFKAAGIDLNDLPGATCDCDCPGCYAKKLTRYTAVFISYVKNTWIARNAPEKIENAVNGFIKAKQPDKFRIHDSGDFFSYDYLVFCPFLFLLKYS